MTFTEEQIFIIQKIVSKSIEEHIKNNSIIRRELMEKLNSLKEGEDENIQKYVLAVKTKIHYYTTNEELKYMIDNLRDIIKTYKLLGKQIILEKKYALLLKCELSELKDKVDLVWNPTSDDEIKENISQLKKLIIEFQVKKSWWFW
jgi:hypothetical protein